MSERFTSNSNTIHVTYSTFSSVDDRIREHLRSMVTIPEAIGTTEIISMIRTNFKKVILDTTPANRFSKNNLDGNIICIGGPSNNVITKIMNEKLGDLINIQDNSCTVFGDKKFTTEFRNGSITKDYGTIIYAPNPFNSKNNRVYFD